MFRLVGVFAIFIVCGSAQSLCGLKEADNSKTCISLRLPWQEEPIYFCTEKENLKYKDRCSDHLSRYCPSEHSNSTLLVATPWDCCALTSTPDSCADSICPAAPFNRTCKEIAPDSRRAWDCCPTYFCDEGPIGSCQMKRLEPKCLNPPKDKTDCIAFKDEHGCCNKYQCASEGKLGMCPMEAQAMDFKTMLNQSATASLPIVTDGHNNATNMTEMEIHGSRKSLPGHHRHGAPITTDLRCVGDYTCPGEMKCCSSQMSAYYDFSQDKSTTASAFGRNKRDRSVYGYCMEPVFTETG